jgi:hypothetical protein
MFDNVPSGWSDSSTERFSGWDIIPTQVPYGIFGSRGFRQFKNETHQPQELTKKGSSGTV